MGKKDACTKEYISNPQIFADAFNYYFFHGKQVVKPEELTVQDITELSLLYEGEKGFGVPIQKFRDVMKLWTVMSNSDATYMLLGVENQTNVHYAMTIRNMLYDALNYASQVEELGKKHRELKDAKILPASPYLLSCFCLLFYFSHYSYLGVSLSLSHTVY